MEPVKNYNRNQKVYDAKRRANQFHVRLPESLAMRVKEYALQNHSSENQALIHIIKSYFSQLP